MTDRPPPVVTVTELWADDKKRDSLDHTHGCPECYAIVACKDFCSTDFDAAGSLIGASQLCDDCANPPSEAIDIFTGEVREGETLRADDNLVYEVTEIDRHDRIAWLETVVGYPKGKKTMRLAEDGSPARYMILGGDRIRQPIWFRVGK